MINTICPKQNLKIDKIQDNVAFNEEKHIYWNIDTGEIYTSVTTFLKDFKNDFDSEHMSLYKAIEKLHPKFDSIKLEVGFKNVVECYFKRMNEDFLNLVKKEALLIKQEWENKRNLSASKGTKVHKIIEDYILSKKTDPVNLEFINNYPIELKYINFLPSIRFGNFLTKDHSIFPEMLVYDHNLKLAGQIDLVIKCYDSFFIQDFKTNQKIETTNKFQQMKYPLSQLPDCNFVHYSLQIEIYKFLLSKVLKIHGFTENKKFNIKANGIIHISGINENLNYIEKEDIFKWIYQFIPTFPYSILVKDLLLKRKYQIQGLSNDEIIEKISGELFG